MSTTPDLSDQTNPAPNPDEPRPLMYLISQLRKREITGRNLTAVDRRACVAYFTAEGYTAIEIAMLFDMSDRTIERDRQAIRSDHALQPSAQMGDEILGQLHLHAQSSIAKLNRAVRDLSAGPKITTFDRIQAARFSFYIYNRFVNTLLKSKYLSTSKSRPPDDCLKTPDPLMDPLVEMITQAMSRESP